MSCESFREAVREHPGNVPLVVMVTLGYVAGGWRGSLVLFGVFGGVYVMGLAGRIRHVESLRIHRKGTQLVE